MLTDVWRHGREDQFSWIKTCHLVSNADRFLRTRTRRSGVVVMWWRICGCIFWGSLGKKIAHKSRNSRILSGGGVMAREWWQILANEFHKITKDKSWSIFLVVIFMALILGLWLCPWILLSARFSYIWNRFRGTQHRNFELTEREDRVRRYVGDSQSWVRALLVRSRGNPGTVTIPQYRFE